MQPTSIPIVTIVRHCDGCTLCCKLLTIHELNKPGGQDCIHCEDGIGCKAYSSRPNECRSFLCGYLTSAELGDEWRPELSRLIISFEFGGRRLVITVDPEYPDNWRNEPFYSKIKQWGKSALLQQAQVVVCIGHRTYFILPDRDVDLGELTEDQLIVVQPRPGPNGPEYDVYTLHKDDPRAKSIPIAEPPAP